MRTIYNVRCMQRIKPSLAQSKTSWSSRFFCRGRNLQLNFSSLLCCCSLTISLFLATARTEGRQDFRVSLPLTCRTDVFLPKQTWVAKILVKAAGFFFFTGGRLLGWFSWLEVRSAGYVSCQNTKGGLCVWHPHAASVAQCFESRNSPYSC